MLASSELSQPAAGKRRREGTVPLSLEPETDRPEPEASPDQTSASGPYREHVLISLQEHEAWDVLLACQGQLRLAPSGHVIGIDMNAALTIAAAARECDLAVLSELLPAAEAGLMDALCSEKCPPN
jgi:hypothetical protein